MFLEFYEFETKYLAGVYKRHWTTIYVEYMLNYIVRAAEQVIAIWLVGFNLSELLGLVFRIIVNEKKSVTYCQQVLFIVKVFCVHKVFIALFVEYPLCFLLCHNLRLHMLKTCSIGKTVLSVSCARFKSHICKLRPPPPPTLRPRNPCICPCLSRRRRSTQISRLCPFPSRRQAEWTPLQASCWLYFHDTHNTATQNMNDQSNSSFL